MLDHCGNCGTDYAYGLVVCPHCQVPNARLAGDEAADTITAEPEPGKVEGKSPRQNPIKPAAAGEGSTIGDTSK